eukprot:gene4779-8365_t
MDGAVFFDFLGTFQFQKGYDYLKKIQTTLEKSSSNTEWILYYNKLIQAEQFYFDLQINDKIGLIKRYENILQYFEKVENEINQEMIEILKLKIELIEIYKKLKKESGRILNFSTFEIITLKIKNKYNDKLKNNLDKDKLKLIKLNLKNEIYLIHSLFKSHHYISTFKFKEYLIEIFKSKSIFLNWIQLNEPSSSFESKKELLKEKKKSSSFIDVFFSKTPEISNLEMNRFKSLNLFSFYSLLFQSSLSKISLIFNKLIMNNSLSNSFILKNFKSFNLISLINQFYDLNLPLSISIIFSTSGKNIQINEYFIELNELDELKGIKSYPCIFCYPNEVRSKYIYLTLLEFKFNVFTLAKYN